MRKDRTVYQCQEFGTVAVPIRDLLHEGELEVYQQVASRGLFDIDYQKNALVLKATRFVGLIPISDRVAIQVMPRTPIPNILYLIWRSGGAPRTLEGFVRGYSLTGQLLDSPERLYFAVFATALRQIERRGILKRYTRVEERGGFRGRFLASRSVRDSFARGFRHRPYFERYEFGANCAENQIVKLTGSRLILHARRGLGDAKFLSTSIQIQEFLAAFHTVLDANIDSAFVARNGLRLMRGLPSRHAHYESALWLAYLLSIKEAISVETLGGAHFETLVVDLSQVFEQYVRKLCHEAEGDTLAGYRVVDGNAVPVELFVRGTKAVAKPDIYVTKDGIPVAAIDAKYKPVPSVEDRYELLAFCEALGVKRAAFVLPRTAGTSGDELFGETRSGIQIQMIRIQLDSTDSASAEAEFVGSVAALLRSEPAVGGRLTS